MQAMKLQALNATSPTELLSFSQQPDVNVASPMHTPHTMFARHSS